MGPIVTRKCRSTQTTDGHECRNDVEDSKVFCGAGHLAAPSQWAAPVVHGDTPVVDRWVAEAAQLVTGPTTLDEAIGLPSMRLARARRLAGVKVDPDDFTKVLSSLAGSEVPGEWSDVEQAAAVRASRVGLIAAKRLAKVMPAELRQQLKDPIVRLPGTAASTDVELWRTFMVIDWACTELGAKVDALSKPTSLPAPRIPRPAPGSKTLRAEYRAIVRRGISMGIDSGNVLQERYWSQLSGAIESGRPAIVIERAVDAAAEVAAVEGWGAVDWERLLEIATAVPVPIPA